jgi:hypothetical protein
MSPTISSMMSSSVTRPFDLAIFVDHKRDMGLAAQKGVELVAQCRRVGHEPRLVGDLHDVDLRRVVVDGMQRAQHVLGMDDADDVVGRAAPDRHARIRALQDFGDDVRRFLVPVDGAHIGAVDHDVGDLELSEVEQAAEAVALFLDHRALLVQHLDGAADFLMRAQHRGIVGEVDAEDLQNAPDNGVDEARQRADNDARKRRMTGRR